MQPSGRSRPPIRQMLRRPSSQPRSEGQGVAALGPLRCPFPRLDARWRIPTRGVNDLERLPGRAGAPALRYAHAPGFVSAVGQAEDHAQLLNAALLTLQEANPSPANSGGRAGPLGWYCTKCQNPSSPRRGGEAPDLGVVSEASGRSARSKQLQRGPSEVRRKAVNQSTQIAVWARAAGRCVLCAKSLLDSRFHYHSAVLVGQIAHNVAASSAGPRIALAAALFHRVPTPSRPGDNGLRRTPRGRRLS